MSPPPPSFLKKKTKILASLAVPDSEYDDLSPKGSVDVGIRELIDEINGLEGCVTTSSCAGRISVFLEGRKKISKEGCEDEEITGEEQAERATRAGVGGKGGGGRWLFVSHDPVDFTALNGNLAKSFGMARREANVALLDAKGQDICDRRFIHFKFEPMILHVLTASLSEAQSVLSAALQAGFRESGALNLVSTGPSEPATPMVGIRTMGLALESLVGFEVDGQEICNVQEEYLRTLAEISNDRFLENSKRIERFRVLLKEMFSVGGGKGKRKDWEDAGVRRERMKAEGLKKRLALKAAENQTEEVVVENDIELGFPEENT